MLRRPTAEEAASYPEEAKTLLLDTWSAQESLLEAGLYDLEWTKGKHFLLTGATGAGLGGALAACLLHLLGDAGSLIVVGRDLKKSLGYETGLCMQALAGETGFGDRFQWLNTGIALDGTRMEQVVDALKKAGAARVVYVNTVAAASSGMLPGCPPVYVRDVDEDGIFQWELAALDERSIEATKTVMGTLAVEFPLALEKNGFSVEVTAFADWRGSLDRSSRDPSSPTYGRQGAYSTSLYLPKEIIQEAVSASYGTGRILIDFFLPMMKTRALNMIPGGVAMYGLYEKLMEKEGVRRVLIPEIALGMLDRMGKRVSLEEDNPFPRLDQHEAMLDLYFFEVVQRLTMDEDSDFYYQRWL